MARAKKTEPETKPENGESQNTRIVQSTRSLRCALTQEEILERADRASHLLVDKQAKEADIDAAKKQAKADIDRLEAECIALMGQVRDKAAYRQVVCDELHDYRTWKVTITRRDTGEVVDTRAMTLAERESAQEPLPLEDGEGEAVSEFDLPGALDDTCDRAAEQAKARTQRKRRERREEAGAE